MTLEEARFEITRLSVKQKRLEDEILAILNRGCLPLEEAKRRIDEIEASGVETEIENGVKYLVEKRTFDGKEYKTLVLPLWYPRYAGMDDVLENIEIEKATIKTLKERQAERQRYNQAWGCEPMDGAYIAAMEKVFEKIEKYISNKTEIEDSAKVIETCGRVTDEALSHYFMIHCKENYPDTYKAMMAGLGIKCILFDGEKFNFLLSVGEAVCFFTKTGCTESKLIEKYVLVKGKSINKNSLNNPNNYRIEKWNKLKKDLGL
jgi:hypothetical protein